MAPRDHNHRTSGSQCLSGGAYTALVNNSCRMRKQLRVGRIFGYNNPLRQGLPRAISLVGADQQHSSSLNLTNRLDAF